MVLLKTLLLAVALILLAVAGIAIKLWMKKNGRFEAKSCCRNNDSTGGCGCHN
jgi:nitrogen fixation-related uncharacterized protein